MPYKTVSCNSCGKSHGGHGSTDAEAKAAAQQAANACSEGVGEI